MRAQAVLLAAVLFGCDGESSPEVTQLRQAVQIFPANPAYRGGRQDALLGSSLAACPFHGFVAGAPGNNKTLFVSLSDGGLSWLSIPGMVGDAGSVSQAVACDGLQANPTVVTAGDQGLSVFPFAQAGAWLASQPIAALARGPRLLAGQPRDGAVRSFFPGAGSYDAGTSIAGSPGFGSGLHWHDTGSFVLIGNPLTGIVQVTEFSLGGFRERNLLPGPTDAGFGTALATGNVHPSPGIELVVGAPGASKVFIYNGEGSLLMTLDGVSGQRFGASVVVEPGPSAGALEALWVGEPGQNQVHRFIGDAGETQTAANSGTSDDFGATMVVSGQRLIVGAPRFDDGVPGQGAIFIGPLPAQTINAVPMSCTVGQACFTPTCQQGVCLGGVACQGPFSAGVVCPARCSPTGACLSADGGALDGGAVDAGEPDAGGTDAGERDAGSSDAGPGGDDVVRFTSCGCSGGTALPLLLLSLPLWRRRRRGPPTPGAGGT